MYEENVSQDNCELQAIQPGNICQDTEQLVGQRLAVIGRFYDVKIEDMRSQVQNLRLIRARKVAVYILHENIGLTVRAAAGEVGRVGVGSYAVLRKFKESVQENEMLSREVTYLGKVPTVNKPIDQRIVSRVTEATGIEETGLQEPAESKEIYARNMAIALMMERGYVSCRDVASYFGMTRYKDVLWITKTTAYRETRSTLLAQQMDWVRRRIYSERFAKFNYKPPAESQELVSASQSLPQIDEKLVHPKIVANVYGAINATADFYSLPPESLIGRSNEFTKARARRAAMIICDSLHVPFEQLGLCFDGRSPYSVEDSVSRARAWAAKDKFFAQELKAIAGGNPRQDTAKQALLSICAYYDLTPEDIRSRKQRGGAWQDRARAVFIAIMERKATMTRASFAAIIGRTESVARATTTSMNQRMATQPRLKAEVEYLFDPLSNSRPLPPKEMLAYVLNLMGMPIEKLQDPQTPDQHRARRLAAFILAEEVAFPHYNIAVSLRDKPENISAYIKNTRKEIIKNPRLALEIDSYLPANAVNGPLTGKILKLISRRYNYDLQDLREGDETDPSYTQALGVAIKLMTEGPKHPIGAIADLLQKSPEQITQLVAYNCRSLQPKLELRAETD
jgi:chromosomal replication initiation ATPase DnaA